MFDHLTDPNPPEFGDSFKQRVVGGARRRQRRTRLSLGGVALAPLVALAGFAVYIRSQAAEFQQVEMAGLVPADAGMSSTLPLDDIAELSSEPAPLTQALNILVVGVDERPEGREPTGPRADTIAVVRIDPRRDQVGILAIPRDLWVSAETGSGSRINAFVEYGAIVEVVSSLLDIDINHYVEVDFDGFESLIDIAGGVSIPFDSAVRDHNTGFNADAGCNTLAGSEALAYVRSRKLETYDTDTDTWIIDPRGDLGRIARQQDLMQHVYTSVLSNDYSRIDQTRIITDVFDDLTVDSGLSTKAMLAVFNAAKLIGPNNFTAYNMTAGITPTIIDGQAVLVADQTTIETAVQALQAANPQSTSTTTPALRPSPTESADTC